MDARLLDLLACPCAAHAPLRYSGAQPGGEQGSLTCPSCRRSFLVEDGIPVLLMAELSARSASSGPSGVSEREYEAGRPKRKDAFDPPPQEEQSR